MLFLDAMPEVRLRNRPGFRKISLAEMRVRITKHLTMHRVQTGSVAHLISYSMRTGRSLHGGKAAAARN